MRKPTSIGAINQPAPTLTGRAAYELFATLLEVGSKRTPAQQYWLGLSKLSCAIDVAEEGQGWRRRHVPDTAAN
ncbi:MAG: hypothetical protein R3D30_07835 [Hyphomicrobiales bacterium]